jgi:hypothetical protein
MVVLTSCQSNETRQLVKAADPGEPIIIDRTTTTKLEVINKDTKSGMNNGYGWTAANGVFETTTSSDIAGIPDVTKVGGISRSDGRVLKDTVDCGEQFVDPVFTLADNPATTDLTANDSIGAKTTKVYTANDGKDGNGQELTLEDLYKYLKVDATLPTPHYEPSSSVTGVRYDYETGDENVRIVWVKVQVDQQVVGTIQGDPIVQQYEVGYVQTKDAAVTPVDPLRIKMNILEMFRTYRKRDQHSIMDMWMSFTVVNAKTGETTDEVETDSRMAAKIGHFGAPSYGYSLEEKRLIGSAPTEVEEELDPNNEEAKKASKTIGKFNFKVDAYKQRYYVHFPVMGRDDAEGGKEAGGERLLFQLNGSYVDPAMDYTFNFQITHRTEVVVKGWQQITPSYQRPNDPGIRYEYLSSYVVEFVDHLYLNGEEIVWTEGDDGVFYYLKSNNPSIEVQNPDYELYYTGSDAHPFHTSQMVVDGWKPSFE